MEKFYLDIGNTHFKMALFRGDKVSIVAEGRIDRQEDFANGMGLITADDQLIISSVRKDILQLLKKNVLTKSVHVIGNQDIPPERLDYSTPETLGVDRFLVANAAFRESGKRVIVIDAGSAITIDLMDEKGIYKGGVILPGLHIQQQSIRDSLPELPAVESVIPEQWPGKSSKECLQWGVMGTLQFALNGFLNRYLSEFRDADVYLTGGDADVIESVIKNDVHFRRRKLLLFDGMRLFPDPLPPPTPIISGL